MEVESVLDDVKMKEEQRGVPPMEEEEKNKSSESKEGKPRAVCLPRFSWCGKHLSPHQYF